MHFPTRPPILMPLILADNLAIPLLIISVGVIILNINIKTVFLAGLLLGVADCSRNLHFYS